MSQPMPPAPMAPKTNTLAIVALILGIVLPLGGIITGHVALGQIKKTGEAGHGMALAGTVLGYVLSVVWILIFLFSIIVPLLILGTAGVNYSYTG